MKQRKRYGTNKTKRQYLNTFIQLARRNPQPIVLLWRDDLAPYIPPNFYILHAIQAPDDHVKQLLLTLSRRIPILTIQRFNDQIHYTNLVDNTTHHSDPTTAATAIRELYRVIKLAPPEPKPPKPPTFTRLQRQLRRQQIALDICQGGTIDEATHKHNVSETLIRQACKENNVIATRKTKTPTKHTQPKHKASIFPIIADLTHTNTTLTKIAKKHKRSLYYVEFIYHKCLQHHIPIQLRNTGKQS